MRLRSASTTNSPRSASTTCSRDLLGSRRFSRPIVSKRAHTEVAISGCISGCNIKILRRAKGQKGRTMFAFSVSSKHAEFAAGTVDRAQRRFNIDTEPSITRRHSRAGVVCPWPAHKTDANPYICGPLCTAHARTSLGNRSAVARQSLGRRQSAATASYKACPACADGLENVTVAAGTSRGLMSDKTS